MSRVFVVDDNESFVDYAVIALTKNGIDAVGFTDPFFAYMQALESPPDLILVDQCMPDMEGTQFAEVLKKAGISSRVVIVSSWPNIEEYSRKQHGLVAVDKTKCATVDALLAITLDNLPGHAVAREA
jgi:DNA-binding NtrC family response regulator